MRLLLGDCIEKMRELPDDSIDAVCTDPPYGIRFMGHAWDGEEIEREASRAPNLAGVQRLTGSPDSTRRKLITRSGSGYQTRAGIAGAYDFSLKGNKAFQEWTRLWAVEAFRVLKPGAYLLSFSSTRTYHRMVCGIEDAGFQIRDTIMWIQGSGFPKSHNLERLAGVCQCPEPSPEHSMRRMRNSDLPTTEAWPICSWCEKPIIRGWGTALKPSFEPIVLARKPFPGRVIDNVTRYGTGALNIDATRIPTIDSFDQVGVTHVKERHEGGYSMVQRAEGDGENTGRWPANMILSHHPGCVPVGTTTAPGRRMNRYLDGLKAFGGGAGHPHESESMPDEEVEVWECVEGCPVGGIGDEARFFYVAKVSVTERNAGLDDFDAQFAPTMGPGIGGKEHDPETATPKRNIHPTVKPIALMRHLCRLVTPTGGVILDPFLGSGTTGIAATLEGFDFVGVEREQNYMEIAEARIRFWQEHGEDGLRIVAERDARLRAAAAERHRLAEMGQMELFG